MLGRLSDQDRAVLLGSADLFVMACRNRWLGLEQEGFGIVFRGGRRRCAPGGWGERGAAEAVIHGETGLVVARPDDPGCVAQALRELLSDPALAKRMGSGSGPRGGILRLRRSRF